MNEGAHVLDLAECTADAAGAVGGKARGLQSLMAQGLPVPPGFAVTTGAYRHCIEAAGIGTRITELLAGASSHRGDADAAAAIAALFTDAVMTAPVADAIRAAYAALGKGPVAVRSSAIAEDTADASFAGQQDTYLWITGADAVVQHVVRCWVSLFTPQVIAYRRRMAVPPEQVAMAVVVQRMVSAVAAGVTMTLEPVTGDRVQLYVESALGLGEGVVKGDVETDRAWIAKDGLAVLRHDIATQTHAYRVAGGAVARVPVDVDEGAAPSLSDTVLRRVAELGLEIEAANDAAMDIEWAVDADGDVFLLQARPETVWSRRGTEPPAGWDRPNTMNFASDPGSTWTTVNAAEAIPGTQTPLAWSAIGDGVEATFRFAFKGIGALRAAETAMPAREEDRVIGLFFGRVAVHLDVLCAWVDRIPGTSGEAMGTQVFGNVPVGYTSTPDRRHYARVLTQLPVPFVRYPALVREDRRHLAQRWAATRDEVATLGPEAARARLVEGADLFTRCTINHTCLVLGAVQPAYDMLERVCRGTSVAAQDLMAGHGSHEETAVLSDVWECSRDRLTLAQFLSRHGYHGPSEGDLSTTVWREDPAPVERLIAAYRDKDEAGNPGDGAGRRRTERLAKERRLLAELPAWKRPLARAALALGARYLPMRGIGKVAFLQALDIGRAAARRVGDLLVEDGRIDTRDDVFFLTVDELRTGCPDDARELIARRRALYDYYRSIDLPSVWQGTPRPATVEFDPDAEAIDGVAASPGVVEGLARVVVDPVDAHVEPGEILVARDTDPSWASLMFLSAGLIADIGGVMSHTAVVARELGIPCVVNTKVATHVLRTGDRIRMDGAGGRIEIVERTGR